MLRVENLTKRFGSLTAVNDVSFSVDQGEIVGLMGPNGSGKTTIFNLISGFLRSTAGKVYFKGRPIEGARPNRIAARGLVRTFQITSVYADRTVIENVQTGHHLTLGSPWLFGRNTGHIDVEARCNRILDFVGLGGHKDTLASLLPAGLQRILSVATAMACDPSLLLLDEPLAGLHRSEKQAVASCISNLRGTGMSILLVEHDVRSMMSLCDRLIVINFGSKIAQGTPEEIGRNEAVIEAYLGQGHAHA